MVATDKDFVFVWQVTKPVEEIKGFLFGPYHTEVTGMVNPGADDGSCEYQKDGVFSLKKS